MISKCENEYAQLLEQEFKESYRPYFKATIQKVMGFDPDINDLETNCKNKLLSKLNKYGITNEDTARKAAGINAAKHLYELFYLPKKIEYLLNQIAENRTPNNQSVDSANIFFIQKKDETILVELEQILDMYLTTPDDQ